MQGLNPAGCRPRVEQEAARGVGSFSLLLGRQAPGRRHGDRRGDCPAAPAGVGEVTGRQTGGWLEDGCGGALGPDCADGGADWSEGERTGRSSQRDE